MIVQKDFLNKLRDFGLNSYESKLWTALLSRGISTAGELSDIASVPRSRSYDVLESLEKKGFIIMKLGKPIKYIAVPPAEVLDRVKRMIEDDATEKTKMLDELNKSGLLDELSLLHSQGVKHVEPTELTGSFKGRNNIYSQIETMLKNAKESVFLMTTDTELIKEFESLRKLIAKASDRGIKIKIATNVNKGSMKLVKELEKYAEIRHTTTRSRFMLSDTNEMMFMLLDDKEVHANYDVGIWVNTSFFVNFIRDFFDSQWKVMKNFDQIKAQ
jgi:sugar-specific transcriptional regulator TrmB